MSSIPAPDAVRPLPARPNLEFERKRAKKLVRASGGTLKLAEAQLQVAREYGFTSWRRLLAYYQTWEVHERTGPSRWDSGHVESVRQLLREFNNRKAFVTQPPDIRGLGAMLSAFVPRFHGLPDKEIFSSTLTEDEARLVVARSLRFSTWDALAAHAASTTRPADTGQAERPLSPGLLAWRSVDRNDLASVQRVIAEHPEIVVPANPEIVLGSFIHSALHRVVTEQTSEARDFFWFLIAHAVEPQVHLNYLLIGDGPPGRAPQEIALLLEAGADPSFVARNGYTVLEHAIARYANAESVDLIARRVTPRKAFWIAAALGDVATTMSFITRHGAPTKAARDHRPDWTALDSFHFFSSPDASDLEVVWEGFALAVLNSRLGVLRALLDRGFPIDYTPVVYNALHFAVVQHHPDVVRFLLERGANPDFRAWPDQQSPRELAKWTLDWKPMHRLAPQVNELFAGYPIAAAV